MSMRLNKLFIPLGQRFRLWARGSVAIKRSRPHARQIVIWTLVDLVLLHAGLLLLVWQSPSLRDPTFHDRQQALQTRIRSANHPQPKLLLVMGTSRAANAFDARHMEQVLREATAEPIVVYNFAIPGEGPITQLMYLRRLLQKGIRPDYLVVEVLHLQYFEFGLPQEAGNVMPDRVLPAERGLVEDYGIPIEPFDESWRKLRLNPWGETARSILLRTYPALVPEEIFRRWNRASDPWGFRPLPDELVAKGEYAANLEVARKAYAPFVHDFRLGRNPMRALRDLLELCRSEGIEVMLVQLPEDSAFRSWYTPESKRALTESFAAIAREFGGNWVDGQSWVPDGNFLDGHHLLRGGARLFSERFSREAALPWVQAANGAKVSGE